jgi:hypothetical protein
MLTITINEDSSCEYMARVQQGGTDITQAGITSISYKVFDTEDGSETATGTLTVSNVVYDSLQTDDRWSLDSNGYNFLHEPPASAFPEGGHTYQVEYLVTPASGQQWFEKFRVRTKPVYTS